jgi:selenocysteine lyase/cysteine desulfurase
MFTPFRCGPGTMGVFTNAAAGIHSQTISKPQPAARLPPTITKCSSMTKHRFIRSSPSVVLATANLRHKPLDDHAFDAMQHWRRIAESERGNAVHWYHHLRGIGDVGCCLTVDQGAQGAVAHFTATAPHPRRVLPKPVVRIALSSWSYLKLAGLARIAEAHDVDLA